MATVKEGQSLKVAKSQGLFAKVYLDLPEDDLQTYKKGAPLFLNGGFAEECANPIDTAAVVGIAASPGSNGATDGAKRAKAIPALPGVTVFEGVLGNSGDDLYVTVNADLGKFAALVKDAVNGGWYLDATTASTTPPNNTRVKVVGFKDAVGTVNGRVYFTFVVDGEDNAGAAVRGTYAS